MAEEDWTHDGTHWINTENNAKVRGKSEVQENKMLDKERRKLQKEMERKLKDDN